jgi:hypothetical protein
MLQIQNNNALYLVINEFISETYFVIHFTQLARSGRVLPIKGLDGVVTFDEVL